MIRNIFGYPLVEEIKIMWDVASELLFCFLSPLKIFREAQSFNCFVGKEHAPRAVIRCQGE